MPAKQSKLKQKVNLNPKKQVMEEKKTYTYELAPALESERGDSNLDRMNRWERQQGIKMSSLTRSEWLDVIEKILALTPYEAEEYLSYLQNR